MAIEKIYHKAFLFPCIFLNGPGLLRRARKNGDAYKKNLLINLGAIASMQSVLFKGNIMKLKSIALVLGFSLLTSAYAANMHMNPKATAADQKSTSKSLTYPGYCEVEIINDSYSNLHVEGTFDDYSTTDFYIYRNEAPHYISLYYYGYCHSSIFITIKSSPFNTIYSRWTDVNSTIRIVPYAEKSAQSGVKAEVVAR